MSMRLGYAPITLLQHGRCNTFATDLLRLRSELWQFCPQGVGRKLQGVELGMQGKGGCVLILVSCGTFCSFY